MQAAYILFFSLMIPLCTLAQECSPEDQTLAEEKVQLTDFVGLLSVDIPENCGDFGPVRLVPCRNEIDVIEGCCMSACQEVFQEYSTECLQSLTELLCAGNGTGAAVPILDRMSSRCDDDYTPLTCGEVDEDEEVPTDDEPEDEDEEPTDEEPEDEEPTDEEPEDEEPTDDEAIPPESTPTEEESEAPAPGSLPDLDIAEIEFEDSEG